MRATRDRKSVGKEFSLKGGRLVHFGNYAGFGVWKIKGELLLGYESYDNKRDNL